MLSLFHLKDCKSLRLSLYNWVVVPVTNMWYREVLLQCPMDAAVLDVGISTTSGLIANRDIIRSKRVKVTGVGSDAECVRLANDDILHYELENQIDVIHCNILDYTADSLDAVYFSSGFSFLPNRVDVLRHCSRMLRGPTTNGSTTTGKEEYNTGVLFFTEEFENPTLLGLYVTPLVKRFLKLLTRSDVVGGVTYKEEFLSVLKEAGVRMVSLQVMSESRFRKQVIVVAKPEE